MLLSIADASTAAIAAPPSSSGALALVVVLLVAAAWIGARMLVRRLRAGKTERVVHGAFSEYALEALANAAKIDGRVADAERGAILAAMRDIAGGNFHESAVSAALAGSKLSKEELVDYLAARAGKFTHQQKVGLLKALLGVFVADGRFDETEHHALVDYTAAIGFDRESAPQRLRGLMDAMVKDKIT